MAVMENPANNLETLQKFTQKWISNIIEEEENSGDFLSIQP